MSAKAKLKFSRSKQLDCIYNKDSGLVIKSEKDRVVIGRIEDDAVIPLDEKALELCEKFGLEPDKTLLEETAQEEAEPEETEEAEEEPREEAEEENAEEEESEEKEEEPKPPVGKGKKDVPKETPKEAPKPATKEDAKKVSGKTSGDPLVTLAVNFQQKISVELEQHQRGVQEYVSGLTENLTAVQEELVNVKKELEETKKKLKGMIALMQGSL